MGKPPARATAKTTASKSKKHQSDAQLRRLAKSIELQPNRNYKQDKRNLLRRIMATEKKQKTLPKPKPVGTTRLMKKLDQLVGSGSLTDRAKMQHFVAEHIKGVVSLRGALVRKEHGTKGKPVTTTIKQVQKNTTENRAPRINAKKKDNVTIFGTFMVDMNDDEQHFEVTTRYLNKDLITIKKSTLPNAGLGAVAARNYEAGESLGYYCGSVIEGLQKEPSQFAILTRSKTPFHIEATKQELWMGLHFSNDPHFLKYDTDEEVDADDKKYNIHIDGKLKVTAIHDIPCGKELFLCYNLHGKDDDDDEDRDDEDSDNE